MPISNLGFEDAGTVGSALSWTVIDETTAELLALFGANPATQTETEAFEREWSSNEDYVFAFVGVPTDLVPPVFDSVVSDGEALEDFTEGWSSNEFYAFTMPSLEAADFGAQDIEAFESGWSSNESYSFTMGSTTTALFDTTFEAAEDFEEEWSSNESYSFTMGSTTTALFNGPSLLDSEETFDSSRFDRLITADATTNTLTSAGAHLFVNGDVVYFRNENGALPGGLASAFPYYVIGATGTTFQVSGVVAGAAVDLTSAGIGTHYVRANPVVFWRDEITSV